jgi:G3E family GTPase
VIPYIFLAGFLGAGKTTVLNGLLKRYGSRKIGVIVNDFGDIGIDASLVEGSDTVGEIRELKAGQIFCSCLAGSFVKSVLAYERLKPDLLIVECSGLAKPSSLKDIVRSISLEAPGVYSYGGMACLIDGERHRILEKSLMVLTEQMEASDLFLVTKSDLIGRESTKELLEYLNRTYPGKPAILSVRGRIEEDLLLKLEEGEKAYRQVDGRDFAGWGGQGRPLTFSFIPSPAAATATELRNRLTPFLSRLYRIKGIAETSDRGAVFFDGTSAGIEIKEAPADLEAGFVVITHDKSLEKELKSF